MLWMMFWGLTWHWSKTSSRDETPRIFFKLKRHTVNVRVKILSFRADPPISLQRACVRVHLCTASTWCLSRSAAHPPASALAAASPPLPAAYSLFPTQVMGPHFPGWQNKEKYPEIRVNDFLIVKCFFPFNIKWHLYSYTHTHLCFLVLFLEGLKLKESFFVREGRPFPSGAKGFGWRRNALQGRGRREPLEKKRTSVMFRYDLCHSTRSCT